MPDQSHEASAAAINVASFGKFDVDIDMSYSME